MNEKKEYKILLVDDDKDMCQSLSDILTLEPDYRVSCATNPIEGLKTIEADNYSLVIIDYKMPEMNGVELLKRIKEVQPDIPVFMLTAFISTELIEEVKKEGADRVLSKFTHPDEILKYVKEAVEKAG